MGTIRAVLVLGACAALGACATAPVTQSLPDPGPAPPPVSAGAGHSSIDGLYHGTSTRYEADRRDCPHPGLVDLYVQDRQFTYRWAYGDDVTAVIGSDGSISGQDGAISISGRLAGTTLDGDLTNGACALHFTTKRRFAGA